MPASPLIYLFLFVAGTALGSFLNVLILRYDPVHDTILRNANGRSRCPHCRKTLNWYELIPLLSFIIQRGKCRSCGVKLTIQYPLVEFLGGLVFILVFWRFYSIYDTSLLPYLMMIIWSGVLFSLLVMSVIDFRERLIPDGVNLFIVFSGLLVIISQYFYPESIFPNVGQWSLLGNYALIFPGSIGFPWDHFVGGLFGLGLFWGLYLISRGRGMGMGDVKLAGALGFFMGWPDASLALVSSFIIGALFSFVLIGLRLKTIKDFIPFGPFMALGVVLIYMFGHGLVQNYFDFFGLLNIWSS